MDKVSCPGICTIETSMNNDIVTQTANAHRERVTAVIRHFEDGTTRVLCRRHKAVSEEARNETDAVHHDCSAVWKIGPDDVVGVVESALASGFHETYFGTGFDSDDIKKLKGNIHVSSQDLSRKYTINKDDEYGLQLMPSDCPYLTKES